MKKFNFRFTAVLEFRIKRERDALQNLAMRQIVYRNELDRKSKLLSNLESSLIRRENLGNHPLQINAYHIEQNYIIGTKQRMIQCDQAILRAKKEMEKSLQIYLSAKKQTKSIELLKEQVHQQYKKERSRLEQKEQDDLATMRSRLKEDQE